MFIEGHGRDQAYRAHVVLNRIPLKMWLLRSHAPFGNAQIVVQMHVEMLAASTLIRVLTVCTFLHQNGDTKRNTEDRWHWPASLNL